MYGRISPIREGDTLAAFRNIIENVVREIDALDNEYILKAPDTELEDYYVGKVLIEGNQGQSLNSE